jgi:hypothetical protein
VTVQTLDWERMWSTACDAWMPTKPVLQNQGENEGDDDAQGRQLNVHPGHGPG